MSCYHEQYDIAAEKIINRVGSTIVLGVPLGLGKPIGLINALYKQAKQNKQLSLTIVTGLTLARPLVRHPLEKKLAEPILARYLNDYEDPLYEKDRLLHQLPENIRVIEFFLSPGKFLHNKTAQQDYVSCKYTNAARDLLSYSINVLSQQVARSPDQPDVYSLSCNTDLFPEMYAALKKEQRAGKAIAIVGEVNQHLPFMPGEAVVKESIFTDIIDTHHYRQLFSITHEEISWKEHLIGLYTSCLIEDNSCLQIGIGQMGNSLANALLFRHQHNSFYRQLLERLEVQKKFGTVTALSKNLQTFKHGLYASTEMFSDYYLQLYSHGVLKKRVYDHTGLQQLLNTKKINETITPTFLDILLENQLIPAQLREQDVKFLQNFGIINETIEFADGYFVSASKEKYPADLTHPPTKAFLTSQGLGKHLKNGKVLHAAFFIGSNDFYAQLHRLPKEELNTFGMTSVARTNSLALSPEMLMAQRQCARFVNTTMMVTLGGNSISDSLRNLQQVSGVGGQFDFVLMAQELPDARSIINCRSTRRDTKGLHSNIIWDYTNPTIPRYLRDIVVTEYGIADCRSKTDVEVIKALLNITDSRFQPQLLTIAKKHGKIPADYVIPECFRHNYPHVLKPIVEEFKNKGFFQAYPFGSELTEEEKVIKQALLFLKNCSKRQLILLGARAMFRSYKNRELEGYLTRMDLLRPKSISDFVNKKLLSFVICNYV